MVRPTSAALVLQEFAEKMLDMSREAGFALERFRGRIGGRLRLGGSTIPGTYIMPQLIGKFHRIYPETQLQSGSGRYHGSGGPGGRGRG